jgi:hypothetical protein
MRRPFAMTRDWEIIAGLKVGMTLVLRPFAASRLPCVWVLGNWLAREVARGHHQPYSDAKADMDTNDSASARMATSLPDHFRRKNAVIRDGLDGSCSR